MYQALSLIPAVKKGEILQECCGFWEDLGITGDGHIKKIIFHL